MKLNAKNVHRLGKFATGKSSRPVLNCALVSSDRMVATDSYKLLEIKCKNDTNELRLVGVGEFRRIFKNVDIDVEHPTDKDGKNCEQFPDYEQVVPKGKPTESIAVSRKYLIEVLQAMKLGGDGHDMVTLELHGGIKPLVVKKSKANDGDPEIMGLLMPLKT